MTTSPWVRLGDSRVRLPPQRHHLPTRRIGIEMAADLAGIHHRKNGLARNRVPYRSSIVRYWKLEDRGHCSVPLQCATSKGTVKRGSNHECQSSQRRQGGAGKTNPAPAPTMVPGSPVNAHTRRPGRSSQHTVDPVGLILSQTLAQIPSTFRCLLLERQCRPNTGCHSDGLRIPENR